MLDKKENFCTYEELKKTVQDLKIKTKEDYIKTYKTINVSSGKKCPLNPRTFYGLDIWENWSVFLNKPLYQKKHYNIYYTYDECKATVQKLSIKSKNEFFNKIKEIISDDIRIPYSPAKVYKNEWKSWGEFLGTGYINNSFREYLSFDDARKWAHTLNFKMQKEWRNLDSNKLPYGIPKNPARYYKNKGWIDYYDWMGVDKKTKMSYGEKIIYDILLANNVSFRYNRSLSDCSNKSKLRFDFYIPSYNICLEYDGIQHFKPIDYFGGEEEFEKTKIRDNIKNLFCKVNNIKLLRFNYIQTVNDIEIILKKELNLF